MFQFGPCELPRPITVASGPLTAKAERILEAARHGAGAVSLKLTFVTTPFDSQMRSYSRPGTTILSPTNHRLTLAEGVQLQRRVKAETDLYCFANFSVVGTGDDDWLRLSEGFLDAGTDALELNFCCPNISTRQAGVRTDPSKGGVSIAECPDRAAEITRLVRSRFHVPIICKIMRGTTAGVVETARVCMEAGADGIHAVGFPNSGLPPLDGEGRPLIPLMRGVAPGSTNGSVCKFHTFLMTATLASRLPDVPLMVSGGLETWKDCIDLVMWGAHLPSICSAFMWGGWQVLEQINEGIDHALHRHGADDLDALRGRALAALTTPNQVEIVDGYSVVNEALCDGCGLCTKPAHCEAITLKDSGKAYVDPDVCYGCGVCWGLCPHGAIRYHVRDGRSDGLALVAPPDWAHVDASADQPELRRVMTPEEARRAALRCRSCTDPSCVEGCPACVDVPGFISRVATGDVEGAYRVLTRSNVLPELCALVCPGEIQCEGRCRQKDAPVPIRELQRYVAVHGRALAEAQPHVPTRDAPPVAVVGAGPAGIACAVRLVHLGLRVTLLDRQSEPGGMLTATVPETRLPRRLALDEMRSVLGTDADRLERRYGAPLTPEHNLDELFAQGYGAVFVAMGLPEPRRLSASRPAGVIDALDFLRKAKLGGGEPLPWPVVVLGGGNVALDAASEAARAGSGDVFLVYRRSYQQMPCWPREREQALALGVHLTILTQPIGYVSDDRGRVKAVRCVRCRLGSPDDTARRRPEPIARSEFELAAATVIEALGQQAPPPEVLNATLPGVALNDEGLIAVDSDSLATSRRGVFAGGDLVSGGATAARAVAEGLRAAKAIVQYLSDYMSLRDCET